MSDDQLQDEPTMEEILSSIRRIISEDADPDLEGQGDPEEENTSSPVEQSFEPESTEEAREDEEEGESLPSSDKLVSNVTEQATQAAMGRLAETMNVSGAPKDDDGQALEGLVRELLRPMIKAYLDENLPRIVNEIVEREVRRISNRR